ncbi:MAG: hypothetical protein JO219_12645 [Candidatus Eremiobacteraeota bacterium]|nr:hypothetical protein [Candidatus Eremiobacteraeota bacterium]MBV8366084.1 hypothetical protein [Candidatus Eremiobacteraeota bacterium]
MKIVVLIAALFVFATAFVVSASPAQADTYTGTVTHVSTENIKAKDSTGKEVSFLLAPSFDQIFSSDGKTTYQMKNLKAGNEVKIVYHQQLGIRYADKIIVLK